MDALKLPWAEPRFIDHEVDGKELRFYQITGFKLFGIKALVRVLIDTIAQLQRNPREDAGSQETRDVERTELVQVGEETKMSYMPKSLTTVKKDAISTDLATYHDSQRRQSLRVLIDEIMDPRSYKEVVGLMVTSLRDEFPTKPTPKEMDEIVESIPIGTFMQLLGGLAKANTGVFGPLEDLVLRVMNRLQDRLEKMADPTEEEFE
jgi:hypothetical protein